MKKTKHNLLNIEDSAILRQESFSLVDWDSERDKLMDRCHSIGAHHHLYKPDRIPCGHLPLVLLFPRPPVKGKRSNQWKHRERSNQRSQLQSLLSNKRTFFDISKINKEGTKGLLKAVSVKLIWERWTPLYFPNASPPPSPVENKNKLAFHPSQIISTWIALKLTQCGQLHFPSGGSSNSGSKQTRW